MAEFAANEVFRDIDEIAYSGDSLAERQLRAERRIREFTAELAKQCLQPGLADKIRDALQRKLEAVIGDREEMGDIDSVFRAAHQTLTGERG